MNTDIVEEKKTAYAVAAEDKIRCVSCGVYLPKSEAVQCCHDGSTRCQTCYTKLLRRYWQTISFHVIHSFPSFP